MRGEQDFLMETTRKDHLKENSRREGTGRGRDQEQEGGVSRAREGQAEQR